MTGNVVWLASYPKSGNTWFRAVFTAWRTGEPVDLNRLWTEEQGSIASSRARIEGVIGMPSSLLTADEIDQIRPRVDEVVADRFAPITDSEDRSRTANSTLTKIHDALFSGPAGELILSRAITRGAIYLIRDPRDVAVSFANHSQSDHDRIVGLMGSSRAAIDNRPDGVGPQVRQRLGTWSSHVRSWVDDAPFPVHVLRYEDCLADPVPSFTDALQFAGFDAEPTAVGSAVERVRFDRLKEQEADHGFRERPVGVDRFFRRGEAGAWRDELEPSLAARIETDHADVMQRFGYLDRHPPEEAPPDPAGDDRLASA